MNATIDPKLTQIFSHASDLCRLLSREHPGIDQNEVIADAVNHAAVVNRGMTSLTSAQCAAMLAHPAVAVAIGVARDVAAEFYNSDTLTRSANAARGAQRSFLPQFEPQREA